MRQKSYRTEGIGKLFLVPTPIGNLEDMTFRAVNTLRDVDLILAEDTRHTQKLLNHFEIETLQKSFHEHNTQERIPQVIEWLQEGKKIAQVSDAGTPSISDPGFELVQACVEASIPVIPLPGANAGITALIASGLVPQPFYFYGFLPRKKKEKNETLEQLRTHSETVILYESPFRLKDTFLAIQAVYGESQPVVLCRELTKSYEEFIRGTASDLVLLLQEEELKGECCILIGHKNPQEVTTALSGGTEENTPDTSLSITQQVEWFIEHQQLSQKEAIKAVAKNKTCIRKFILSRMLRQKYRPSTHILLGRYFILR